MTVVRRDIKFNEKKALNLSLERELHLHAKEELLVPKDEPQDVDQPHEEDQGVYSHSTKHQTKQKVYHGS